MNELWRGDERGGRKGQGPFTPEPSQFRARENHSCGLPVSMFDVPSPPPSSYTEKGFKN